MKVGAAAVTYTILMSATVLIWFILGRFIAFTIAAMVSGVHIAEVTQVGQNCVYGIHILFVLLLIVWTVWFTYVAHSQESEQSFISQKL